MPIYSYHCGACNQSFRVLAKMSAPAPSSCELCHAEGQLNKMLSRTSFQLKGGGWYNEGYSGKSNQGQSSASSDGGESSSSSAPAVTSSTGSSSADSTGT